MTALPITPNGTTNYNRGSSASHTNPETVFRVDEQLIGGEVQDITGYTGHGYCVLMGDRKVYVAVSGLGEKGEGFCIFEGDPDSVYMSALLMRGEQSGGKPEVYSYRRQPGSSINLDTDFLTSQIINDGNRIRAGRIATGTTRRLMEGFNRAYWSHWSDEKSVPESHRRVILGLFS